ncbi:Hypothetical_protein [Hexamita inflata]|uniref:Hypothetical_protein n=1 Tax=Hexamita inflata TaxID=28002 RepID=A0AA86P964_9EUKA|nr:Hypothetical protein HINF_LOCUS19462 [Hexamita inflata]
MDVLTSSMLQTSYSLIILWSRFTSVYVYRKKICSLRSILNWIESYQQATLGGLQRKCQQLLPNCSTLTLYSFGSTVSQFACLCFGFKSYILQYLWTQYLNDSSLHLCAIILQGEFVTEFFGFLQGFGLRNLLQCSQFGVLLILRYIYVLFYIGIYFLLVKYILKLKLTEIL